MRIKTTKGEEVRKIEATKTAGDVRITMMSCPVFIVEAEEIKVMSMVISKKTLIEKLRKFLEELEA